MQVVVLLLLVAGLALLVLGLMTGSTPLVAASIAASLLAAYVVSRARQRQDGAAGTSKAPDSAPEKERVSAAPAVMAGVSASKRPAYVHAPPGAADALAGSADTVGRPGGIVPDAARPARNGPAGDGPDGDGPDGARADRAETKPGQAEAAPDRAGTAADPAETESDQAETESDQAGTAADQAETALTGPDPAGTVDSDDPATPEPAVADTDPPLRSRGDEPVWVIDGRPRYHLPHCGFLLGRQSELVPLRQAVEDGFSPCALCDPDTGLAAR